MGGHASLWLRCLGVIRQHGRQAISGSVGCSVRWRSGHCSRALGLRELVAHAMCLHEVPDGLLRHMQHAEDFHVEGVTALHGARHSAGRRWVHVWCMHARGRLQTHFESCDLWDCSQCT